MRTASSQDGKIEIIQVLRGVAATLVAGFHLNAAGERNTGYDGIFNIFRHGEVGVDLFFVISGFIIFYTSTQRPNLTAWKFAKARFWRIFPPYWAILALYVALALALGMLTGDNSKIPDFGTLLVSVFLLPYPDYVIPIAWTLAVEILFYAVFMISFFGFGVRGFFVAMSIWTALALGFSYQSAIQSDYMAIAFVSMVIQFLFGAIIAYLYMNRSNKMKLFSLIIGSILICLYMAGYLTQIERLVGRGIIAGIPAALILYGILIWRGSVPKLLILWGEASYILYLVHLLVFSIIGRVVEMGLGINVYGSTLWMLGMLVIATVVSCLATHYLEQPYQRWYRHRAGRPQRGLETSQV